MSGFTLVGDFAAELRRVGEQPIRVLGAGPAEAPDRAFIVAGQFAWEVNDDGLIRRDPPADAVPIYLSKNFQYLAACRASGSGVVCELSDGNIVEIELGWVLGTDGPILGARRVKVVVLRAGDRKTAAFVREEWPEMRDARVWHVA